MQRNDVSNRLLTSTRARLAEIGGRAASTEPQPCLSGVLHPSHAHPADWRSGGKNASKLRNGPLLVHISARWPPVCKRRLQIAHIPESVQFRSALTPRGAQPFDHYRCVNGGNRSPDRIQISFERAPPSLVLGGGRGSHFARCGPGSIHPTPLFEKGGGSARAHAAGANVLGGSAQ